MRLSIFVATLLFVETFGFSTVSRQQRTPSSLSVLSAPEEATKSESPAELLKRIQASRKSDVENILSTLEKRIENGPGSLSKDEIHDFQILGDKILADIKSKQEAEAKVEIPEEPKEEAPPTPEVAPPAPQAVQEEPAAPVVPMGLPDLASLVVSEDEIKVDDDDDEGIDAVQSLLPKLAGLVATEEDIAIDEEDPVVKASSTSSGVKPTTVSVPKTALKTANADPAAYAQLHDAALQLDSTKVASLIESGLQMDESTTSQAFWAVVRAVDNAEKQDQPLSADVPRMLHHIFDADLDHLLTREQHRTNVTCMQPRDDGVGGKARAMNYIFDDSSHKDLPLEEGRRCEDGQCCDACSRNIFPTFALENEIDFNTFPEINSITFNELETVSAATIIQFVRLVERVRRTIAHEYGLDLSTILPLQAYSRKYVAGMQQQGGGGGEGDHVTLHTDEATHDGYHYSCVLYLSSSGIDFQGGAFVFNDPAANEEEAEKTAREAENLPLEEQIRRAGRTLTPINPMKGNAVIFSSGWENMHEVETITSGTRYAVPCFFTTCPVPEAAYTQMHVGKPKSDEDIADEWLHLLLAHREELPHESTGRVKELLMKWHYLCTPLSQHS